MIENIPDFSRVGFSFWEIQNQVKRCENLVVWNLFC